MKNDINFVSMIHLADTDGNRFVAIYKPMSEEERQALLERYWQENRWAFLLMLMSIVSASSMCFRLMTHVFRISGLKT